MRRIIAILCTLFILCSSLNLAVFATAAETENVQTNAVVLEQNTDDLVIAGGSTLDLNGYSVNHLHVTGEGAVYCTDSATDDFTVADGIYGKITGTVEGTVLPADGYMQVSEDDGISFHCINLNIHAMTLRPDVAGVYYTSNFAGDEVVAAQVESYGVALSVKGEPTPGDKNCGYSYFSDFQAGEGANAAASGTLLKNILKTTNTDAANIRNANMEVYGRAYIKTADGYVFGATVSRSLKEQVEAVDEVWATLQPKQKAAAVAMYKTYPSVMADWNIPNMVSYSGTEIQPGLDGEITLPISVNAVDGVVAEEVTVSVEGISVTVPAGVKLAEGATGLTLKVTPLETSEVTIELTASQVLMPVDVHVDGISAENTVPLTIGLGAVMAKDLNMGNYAVYHVENGKAGKMSLIASDKPFTAHNQYKYTLDGELTLHMATFSEVAVVSDTNNFWQGTIDTSWYNTSATELYIRNADQLAGLSAIVGGMNGLAQDSFANKTINLAADIDMGDGEENNVSEKIFYPIGYYNSDGTYEKTGTAITSGFRTFEGTFDGNGHTISNIYQNTWEMKGDNEEYDATLQYYRDGMGLFGKVYGGTVKNLTVRNFKSDGEFTTTGVIAAYADFGATFENISIFNCNPRVYNIGNGGIVGCVGWYTKAVTEEKVSFKNITVDNSNKISALWGSWDVACGGLVGQYYPTSGQSSAGSPANAGIYMENCHISAQMDVYNDVCANYQYYAYRYAGILIGSVRENVTVDGHVYPKMDGIEAKDCTVHFGDWNDYYYCELVDNTTASYTHDYQMSRLNEVKAINGTTITYLDGTTGTVPASGRANYVIVDYTKGHGTENATCYHFLNGEEWTHDMGGFDVGIDENGDGLDDLKEDKQHIYREFNNLVTGYGWGVTSKAVGDLEGVTILDRLIADSVEKFEAKVETDTVFKKGATINMGDLFGICTALPINTASVWANAVRTSDGIDVATFTQNTEDWTKSTLTFDQDFVGQVKVTIQDYQFCKPTELTLQLGNASVEANLKFHADGKTAYCPVCENDVEWTEYTGQYKTEKRSVANVVTTDHFYLNTNLEFDTQVALKTDENTHFHLNGHDIVPQALADSSLTYQRVFDSSQTFDLMGTGIVYGGNKPQSSSAGTIMFLSKTSNTLCIHSGTLMHAEGFTPGNEHGLLQIGTAGKIVIKGGTLDPAGNRAIYALGEDNNNTNVAVVEISGGTINGHLQIGSTYAKDIRNNRASLKFTGGVVNGTVYSDSQAPITIGGTAAATNIDIPADSKLTVQAGWTGNAKVTFATDLVDNAVPEANGAAEGNFTGILTMPNGCKLENKNNTLAIKTAVWGEFDPVGCNGYAYCERCGETAGAVEWTALTGDNRIGAVGSELTSGAKHHIYLAENVDVKQTLTQTLSLSGTNTALCLHLNGKTLTNHGRMFATGASTLAIMGDGNVTFAADMTWTAGTAAQIAGYQQALVAQCTNGLYIYGGTYSVTGNAVTLDLPTINATCPVYIKNATVNGYIAAEGKSNINLEEGATVDEIRISSSSKVTIADGWSGSAVLDVDYDATTGEIPAANVVVEGDFTGTLTLKNGRKLVKNGTGLMMDRTFVVGADSNYCEHCNAFVAWTALNNGERITGDANHWYVATDMQAMEKNRLIDGTDFKSASVCLYLNGKTLTTGASYSNGAIYASNSTTVNIMGDGAIVNGGAGSIFRIATGTVNLYGGTYTSANNKVIVTDEGSGFSNVNLYGSATVGAMIASHQKCRITLDSSWTGSLKLDASALMVDEKLPETYLTVEAEELHDGAITDMNDNPLYYTNGQLGYKTFTPGDETNYCRVCNAYVEWDPLPQTLDTFPLDGTHYHFFVENDMEYTKTNMFYASKAANNPDSNGKAPNVCLYLNNKTLTMKDCLYASNGGTFNIIGDGILTSKSGYVLRGATSYIHLYGGTYIAPTGGGVYSHAGAGTPNLYVHEDAKLQGNVLVTHGTVTIYDQAVIEKIIVQDAKTTFASGWTGTASLEVLESLLEDGVVPTTYVKVEGTYAGDITSPSGTVTVDANGAITITAPTTEE